MPRPGSTTVHSGLLDAIEVVLGTTRPESGHLSRPTRATSVSGGQEIVWASLATIEVRIAPVTSATAGQAEIEQAAQLAGQKAVIIAFPPGTDVRLTDRFVTASGRTFEISTVFGPASYEAERRVLAVEPNP